MLIKKALAFLPGLLLAGALVGLSGCGPGTASRPTGQPDTVAIQIDQPAPGPTQEKPVVTLNDAAMVQQLYETIYALPFLPEQRACTAELGPHYNLSFSQGGAALITVTAMRDGCRPVTIAGESQDRQGTQAFWSLLDDAIHEGAPPATPDALAIVHTPDPAQPPETAQILDAETAQQLYNAILALDWLSDGSSCSDAGAGIPEYQLAFQVEDQAIPAIMHSACDSIDLQGANLTRGGWYQMDDQFKQLFQQIIDGASFAPASPDHLELSFQSGATSSDTIIDDAQTRQNLYQKVFTLPAIQLPPDCPSEADKEAGTAQWYTLNFSQWNLPILQISAYEGSCTFVGFSPTGQNLQGDQEFWDMLHQAAGHP